MLYGYTLLYGGEAEVRRRPAEQGRGGGGARRGQGGECCEGRGGGKVRDRGAVVLGGCRGGG